MTTSRLPIDVKTLLTDHIDSVGQLEALLVFFNNPTTLWTASSLSFELRSHETMMAQQLITLRKSGFIDELRDGEFALTKDEKVLKKISLLRDAYKEMSVSVIAFIYEKPNDKLKGFADAFKFKKD